MNLHTRAFLPLNNSKALVDEEEASEHKINREPLPGYFCDCTQRESSCRVLLLD